MTKPQILNLVADSNRYKEQITELVEDLCRKDMDFYNFYEMVNMSHLKNPLHFNFATIILIIYIIAIFVKIPYICNKNKNIKPYSYKTIIIDVSIDTLLFLIIWYLESCLNSDTGLKCQGISTTLMLSFICLICYKIYFVENYKIVKE